MALKLTEAFKTALENPNREPTFVLKFDGIPYWFSALPVKEMPKYDDEGLYYDAPELFYDKPYKSNKSKDYIVASDSSNSISQQIEPDKAGGTSASNMTFKIVDFQQEMSKIISPSFTLDEFLGIGCTVYFTDVNGTSFPEDSIVAMYGTVEEASGGAGFVRVTVAHPQNLLRQDFCPPYTSKLTENFEFRSLTLNGLRYFARFPYDNPVKIQFITGGSLAISIADAGTYYSILITIISGVTTAKDVKKIIQDTLDAEKLIEVESIDENFLQTAYALTELGDSSYLAVESLDGFVNDNADETFKSYIKLNNEILKVTSVDTLNNKIYIDNSLINRGLFKSVKGQTGDVDDEISSFYVFEGLPIQMALKLILSGGEDQKTTTGLWGYVPSVGAVANSVYFSSSWVGRDLGLVVGDLVSVDGLFTDRVITEIIEIGTDSYIIVNGADIGTGTIEKAVSFKSKYNVLPIGCGLQSKYVDVEQFEMIAESYPSEFVPLRFYVDESLDMKEFLESELFFPSTLYLIPRKGRISVTITRPATAENMFVIDSDVALFPSGIEISRSVNRYFYNAIKWYFNRDSIESSKFLDKNITINTDSVQRFKRGTVPLLIRSNGLRPDLGAEDLIERATRRFIDRYKNAPESLSVVVPLSFGIPIEVGDAVVFGDSQTQITDTTQGSRDFQPRVFEVINKEQSMTNVRLVLLETSYGVNGKYGTIAPSSILDASSTGLKIVLKKSFGTGDFESELVKWIPYVGQRLLFHNDDWTFTEETTLTSISSDKTGFSVFPALSFVDEDLIVEPAYYSDIKNDPKWSKWKSIHCFASPQVEVLLGVSYSEFTVNIADQDKFFAGQPVRVHNDDFTIDSGLEDYLIDEVIGNTIKLKKPLPFIPTSGQLVDLIGFKDGGRPYLWV